MLGSRVDLSMTYSPQEPLPPIREIERAEQKSLAYLTGEIEAETEIVKNEPYIAANDLVKVVNLAIALGRPLLLQGDPGCGKTRLAYAVAYALGLPLETAFIKSTSRAQDLLYRYDAVSRLYDAQLGANTPQDEKNQPRVHDIRNYIKFGPLGRAIIRAAYGRRSVMLIDEIDKADIDFPNDLLWELDRLEFRVEEASDMHFSAGNKPNLRPIVFVTHNEEKALPSAFLRRCIYHYIDFPTTRREVEDILKLHAIEDDHLRQKAFEIITRLRKLELSKKPGLSELLDWVSYLQATKTSAWQIKPSLHIGALLKQRSDQELAMQEFQKDE